MVPVRFSNQCPSRGLSFWVYKRTTVNPDGGPILRRSSLCFEVLNTAERERECEWFIIVGREMSMQIIGPMHTDSYIMFHPHTYTNTHTRAHTHSTTVSIKFTYLHDNMYFLNIYIICICILCEYVGVRS